MFRRFSWAIALAGVLAGCAKEPAKNGGGTDTGPYAGGGLEENPVKRVEPTPTGLVVVKGSSDLGAADYGEKRSTTFTVKNYAPKAVTLEVIEKSCACSAIDIKPFTLSTGDSAEITLTWLPKLEHLERESDTVLVRATIQAKGDPKTQMKLEARGRLAPALRVTLPRGRLDFERMELGDLKAGKKELAVVVYTREEKHKGFTLEAKSSSPGIKLVPPEPVKLDAVELSSLKAVDGYRLNIRCAEGLPIGAFREVIRLKSSIYPNQELEIPVEGIIEAGAVSIKPVDKVALPERIDLASGYKCAPLTVTLNFEADRKLTFESAEPAFLQVTTRKLKENVWQIDLQIPAGEAAVRKLLTPEKAEEYLLSGWDRGVITFKTDHSLVPVLKIPVDASQFKR